MTDQDIDYLERRLNEELVLAEKSASQPAKEAHASLAAAYEERVSEIRGSQERAAA